MSRSSSPCRLALFLVSTAVGCDEPAAPPAGPPPPARGITSASAAPTPAAPGSSDVPEASGPASPAQVASARKVLERLAAGEVGEVRKLFDKAMNEALPDDASVEKLWKSIEVQAGALKEQLSTTSEKSGEHTIVIVSCTFEKSAMDARLVFDAKDRLAGISITPAAKRPQTPKPPFPYATEEVAYENEAGKITIGGTLSLPEGAGPHPVVLLITGSGSQDRDETLFGHKPFLVIADHLTRKGIAVLRVDDRGVGKTTGKPGASTLDDHVTDAEAGVAFLKTRKDIDPKRIGLIGHSEGGVIAPMVAAKSPDVAFLVSLAGPAVSGAELNPMQVEALLKAEGKPVAEVAAIVAGQKKLMNLIVADAPDERLQAAVKELAIAGAKLQGAAIDDEVAAKKVAMEMLHLLSPWFESWAKNDPAVHLAKVKVPVLILIGGLDMQVPADVNLERAKAALAKAGNTRVRAEKIPDLNHLFQTAKTGSMQEYATLEETFAPPALDLMTAWLLETTGASP